MQQKAQALQKKHPPERADDLKSQICETEFTDVHLKSPYVQSTRTWGDFV